MTLPEAASVIMKIATYSSSVIHGVMGNLLYGAQGNLIQNMFGYSIL